MIDFDGSVKIVGEDIMFINGLGFFLDGKIFYYFDIICNFVFWYLVNEDGMFGFKMFFVKMECGVLDGLVVFEDGVVWVVLVCNGKGVVVYELLGVFCEYIEIFLLMCMSVCFGGDDLKDFYIVSGLDGMDLDRFGVIFWIRIEVVGLFVIKVRVKLVWGFNMMFEIFEEYRMFKDFVVKFVDNELIFLE